MVTLDGVKQLPALQEREQSRGNSGRWRFGSEAADAIASVSDSVIPVFRQQAEELLSSSSMSAVDLLAKALANAVGYIDIKKRSLLSSVENCTTLRLTTGSRMYTPTYVLSTLKRFMPEDGVSNVQGVALTSDGRGAVFDVPSAEVQDYLQGAENAAGVTLDEVKELPALQEREQQSRGGGSRMDTMSVHDSSKSNVTNLTTGAIPANEVDNFSPIVDWSSLVIEPENDGDENDGAEKGIPDENPADEKAMFALFGLKTEENERDADVKPVVPIPTYALDDSEGAAMLVDDKAPDEPLIAWDERHPKMDVGTPYPHMAAFRKAIKRNGKGKKDASPWFDVSVSNLVPSTPTKTKNQDVATTSSPGPITRSQAAATTSSPRPVTRSQAAATPRKSPAKGKKKMTPKKRKLSEL
ncbi:hypothetical protein ACQ4PT_030353 [Festuca glaucescens]